MTESQSYHGAYIDSGRFNGFYTLRMVNASPGFYDDKYCRVLARDWATAWAKYEEFCKRSNRQQMTFKDDEFELSEWGSGGSADWSIGRYWEWKVVLEQQGQMPFGKHRGTALAALPTGYRTWLRGEAKTKVATGSKFIARSWSLVVKALEPYERADEEAEGDARSAAITRAAEQAQADAGSQHLGTIGERLKDLRCKVERVNEFKGDFPDEIRYMLKLRDAAGNILVWWTNKRPGELSKDGAVFTPATEGTEWLVTGTVKKHGEYNGSKQTSLSRCKLKQA